MSASTLIDELMQIHPKGFDLSLDRISKLLNQLDNLQNSIPPAIHVAGTNGKGSTIAYCRAILEAAGKPVHVDTSPHLVRWHERFRIGGLPTGNLVEDAVFADAISRVAEVNQGKPITVYEILTSVMFLLFSEHPADFSLIEVGLGGRFDSTNVLESPAVSVITPIDMDHQMHLGDTLAKIAFEKAGIIKPGIPVVCGVQHEEAFAVIEQRAEELGCELISAGRDFDYFEQNGRFVFQDLAGLLDLQIPALHGQHQLMNAALAIATIRKILPDLSNGIFDSAMGAVEWPARMQRIRTGKIADLLGCSSEIWLDGGHNPAAGKIVADHLATLNAANQQKTLAVCAMLNTKDPQGYFEALAPYVDHMICIPVRTSDAGIEPAALAQHSSDAGIKTETATDIVSAVQKIADYNTDQSSRVLFCGSLYLAGDVLEFNGTPPF